MKPSNPFVIAGYRGPDYFCDRVQETAKVVSALTNERNVTLIAPRRYGKTGLIKNVFRNLPRDYATIYVDIYATRNLREFTQVMASSVLGALDTGPEKALAAIGRFFKSLRPTVTPDANGNVTFSFSVEQGNAEDTLKGVFEYLASKEKRIVVAIDEFQQILYYPETGTEALLRGHVQFLENTNFVFAGSRHHLMSEMFSSPRHPFYQSTDFLSLDVIDRAAYSRFAGSFFNSAGRKFDSDSFNSLYGRFDGVTWYVQSVLNRIWSEGEGLDSPQTVERAVSSLVDERSLVFHDLLAAQTDVGSRLLMAIAAEKRVAEITSGEFLRRHGFAAPSSVRTALTGLLENDLVYKTPRGYIVYDRLLDEYLRRVDSVLAL